MFLDNIPILWSTVYVPLSQVNPLSKKQYNYLGGWPQGFQITFSIDYNCASTTQVNLLSQQKQNITYGIQIPHPPYEENHEQSSSELRYPTYCAMLLFLLFPSELCVYPPSCDSCQSSSSISPTCLEDTPHQSRYS